MRCLPSGLALPVQIMRQPLLGHLQAQSPAPSATGGSQSHHVGPSAVDKTDEEIAVIRGRVQMLKTVSIEVLARLEKLEASRAASVAQQP